MPKSRRLGKLDHPKTKQTVFVGVNGDGRTCGHQHKTARAAKRCLENVKRGTELKGGWYIKTLLPMLDSKNGRREMPEEGQEAA